MSILEFIRTIFSTETEVEKLEKFIVSHDPQTVSEVEELTRKFDRQQTMQWFNNY